MKRPNFNNPSELAELSSSNCVHHASTSIHGPIDMMQSLVIVSLGYIVEPVVCPWGGSYSLRTLTTARKHAWTEPPSKWRRCENMRKQYPNHVAALSGSLRLGLGFEQIVDDRIQEDTEYGNSGAQLLLERELLAEDDGGDEHDNHALGSVSHRGG